MRIFLAAMGLFVVLAPTNWAEAAPHPRAPIGEIIGVEKGQISDIEIYRGKAGFHPSLFEPVYEGDAVACPRANVTIKFEVRGGSLQRFDCGSDAKPLPQVNMFEWRQANLERLLREFPNVFGERSRNQAGRDTSPAQFHGPDLKASPFLPQGELRMSAYAAPVDIPVIWVGAAGHAILAQEGSLRAEAWSKASDPGLAVLHVQSLPPGRYILSVADNGHRQIRWSVNVQGERPAEQSLDQRVLDAAEAFYSQSRVQDRLQALTELSALADQDYTAFALLRWIRGQNL